jgi:hypothetical protein
VATKGVVETIFEHKQVSDIEIETFNRSAAYFQACEQYYQIIEY